MNLQCLTATNSRITEMADFRREVPIKSRVLDQLQKTGLHEIWKQARTANYGSKHTKAKYKFNWSKMRWHDLNLPMNMPFLLADNTEWLQTILVISNIYYKTKKRFWTCIMKWTINWISGHRNKLNFWGRVPYQSSKCILFFILHTLKGYYCFLPDLLVHIIFFFIPEA
jgi:hypothetical protein